MHVIATVRSVVNAKFEGVARENEYNVQALSEML